MSRMRSLVILFASVATFAGCKSGPQGSALPGFASRDGYQSTDNAIDPRVSQVEQEASQWFGKAREPIDERSKAYAEAKRALKDPEGLMLKQAAYMVEAAEKKPEALEQARQIYAMLLKDNPRSLDAMMGLAKVDYRADRLSDAESMFKTIVKRFPNDTTALASAAQFYNETDRPTEALQLLENVVKTRPEDRLLRTQMGVALVRSGRVEEAVPHFTKVSGQARAYAQIGSLLNQQNDSAQATQYLRKALQRDPEMKEAKIVLASMQGQAPGQLRHANATAQDVQEAVVRQADAAWFESNK